MHEVGEASNILQSSLNNEGGNMNNSIKHVMKSWRLAFVVTGILNRFFQEPTFDSSGCD